MAATLLERLDLRADDTILVGDRLATDVRMAHEAGMAAALVLTGATTAADVAEADVVPDFVLEGVADVLPTTRPPTA